MQRCVNRLYAVGDTCIIEKELGTGGCAGDGCLASMTRLTDARLVLTARICLTPREWEER